MLDLERLSPMSDKTINNHQIHVLQDDKFLFIMEGCGGRRYCDGFKQRGLPCGSDPSELSENQGLCYIETANLDGETNLKLHQSLPETATTLSNPTQLTKLDCEIHSFVV